MDDVAGYMRVSENEPARRDASKMAGISGVHQAQRPDYQKCGD